MTSPGPLASIVVATHKRRENLSRLVSALDTQTLASPYEMVVVDDGSNDGTRELLAKLATATTHPLRALSRERAAGPATARNLGWRAAASDMIAFTDDDCVPTPTWLERIVRGLEHNDLVQGRTVPDPEQLAAGGMFSRTLTVPHETGFYECCNIGYRRTVLERLDGFDERFRLPAGEDTDLAWRAIETGARTHFDPEALVHHDVHPSSYADHIRAIRRWRGVVDAVRLHPQLREKFEPGLFWLPHQRPAALVVGGLATSIATVLAGKALLAPFGFVLAVPYVRHRLRWRPITTRRRDRLLSLPLVLFADACEAFFHLWLVARRP